MADDCHAVLFSGVSSADTKRELPEISEILWKSHSGAASSAARGLSSGAGGIFGAVFEISDLKQ